MFINTNLGINLIYIQKLNSMEQLTYDYTLYFAFYFTELFQKSTVNCQHICRGKNEMCVFHVGSRC